MKLIRLFKDRKGVSSVFMAIFIALIVTVLGLSLFTSLEMNTNVSIQRLKIDQSRNQEAVLVQRGGVTVCNDIIQSIVVNNTGSILEKISGVYIDSQFILDPAIFLNPQGSASIDLSSKGVSFSKFEFSKLQITTERGTTFWSTIADLMPSSGGLVQGTVYGPFRLIWDQFHWTDHPGSSFDGSYLRSTTWHPGWLANGGTYVIWRIRVQNVDLNKETITLGGNSCLTVVSNYGQTKTAYFIDTQTSDYSVAYKDYATIYFVWSTPGTHDNPDDRDRNSVNKLPADQHGMVFLILQGKIGDSTFGETVPFEANLSTK